MEIQSLTELGENIRKRARDFRTEIQGPVTFDYGYGWSTSITFWSKDRRVHLYFEGIQGTVYVIVEAAEVGPPRHVRLSRIQSADEAWAVVSRFLRARCDFEELPGPEWVTSESTHDEHIPHPPEGVQAPPTAGTQEAAAAPPVKRAGEVLGVGAVMLYSNDPKRLAQWYRDVLGLSLKEQDGRFYGTLGKLQFGIFPSEVPIPAGQRTTMVNYAVSHFDLFVADLVGRGGELVGLDENQYGKFAHTKDADGNPVEIWGAPEK